MRKTLSEAFEIKTKDTSVVKSSDEYQALLYTLAPKTSQEPRAMTVEAPRLLGQTDMNTV